MKSRYAILLSATGFLLNACGGGSDSDLLKEVVRDKSKGTYTVTLDDVQLLKKGSSETLTVPDLPASGATLTRE